MAPLVLGAGGFLGLNIVDALTDAGRAPVAGIRRTGRSLPLRKRRVPQVRADLDDVASLAEAMHGHEVVIHAAGHYPRTSRDRAATLRTGNLQTRNVLEACARAGVRRLVAIGSLATVAPRRGGPSTEADTWAHEPGLGVYHDLKWQMEQQLLAEDRFEVTIALPGACLGPWDLRVGTSAPLVALAWGRCPPLPTGTINPVDARDVGRAALALAEHPAPPKRVILAAENVELHGWLREMAVRYGVAAPPPPLPADEAVARADRAEAEAERTGERAIPARELVDLVVHGVPVDTSLAEASLGVAFTPLAETLDAFDAWARRLGILPKQPELEIAP